MADKATWPEIQNMSLDDIDLQNLLLDSLDEARAKERERQENK